MLGYATTMTEAKFDAGKDNCTAADVQVFMLRNVMYKSKPGKFTHIPTSKHKPEKQSNESNLDPSKSEPQCDLVPLSVHDT